MAHAYSSTRIVSHMTEEADAAPSANLDVAVLIIGLGSMLVGPAGHELWRRVTHNLLVPLRIRDGATVIPFLCTEIELPALPEEDVPSKQRIVQSFSKDMRRSRSTSCYLAALAYERRRARRFTHFVTSRPDVIWFAPVPPLTGLCANAISSRARVVVDSRRGRASGWSDDHIAEEWHHQWHEGCGSGSDSPAGAVPLRCKPQASSCIVADDQVVVVPRRFASTFFRWDVRDRAILATLQEQEKRDTLPVAVADAAHAGSASAVGRICDLDTELFNTSCCFSKSHFGLGQEMHLSMYLLDQDGLARPRPTPPVPVAVVPLRVRIARASSRDQTASLSNMTSASTCDIFHVCGNRTHDCGGTSSRRVRGGSAARRLSEVAGGAIIPHARLTRPDCTLAAVSDAAKMYDRDGLFVLPGLLSRGQVRAMAERVHAYTHARGELLRQNAPGSGFGPSRGGWVILDFPSDPILRPMLSAIERSSVFREVMRGMFRGRRFRLLARNDIYVDYATNWHYDSLQKQHRHYWSYYMTMLKGFPTLCSGPKDEKHHIVTVAVYLQDHDGDSRALSVQRRRPASCVRNTSASLRTRMGDVVVFDTTLLHRGQTDLVNPTFATGHGVEHRTLYTLTFGSASCWSDGFDRAHRVRNMVMNNASLCGMAMDESRPGTSCERDVLASELARWQLEMAANGVAHRHSWLH